MSNIVTDTICNRGDSLPAEDKAALPQEDALASASLAMSLTHIHRGVELFNVCAHLPAYLMDEDLFQEAWPSRKALNKQGKFHQKRGATEGGPLHSKHSDTVDSSHLQNRQALFESKGLLTRLNQRAQDSLVHQLENRLKILQEQEEVFGNLLKKFEKLAEKLKETWESFQKVGKKGFNFDVAKRCFLPFISCLREYYADDPEMLKQIDKIEQDESRSEEKLLAWNRRSWLFRFFSSWHGDDGHAMSIFYDHACTILSKMMEPVLRGRLPRVDVNGATQGMVHSQEDLDDWVCTVRTQILDVLSMIAILGGDDKDAIFAAEAILMYLVRLALENNSKKDKDQVQMMNMNLLVQEKNCERSKKNLEAIQAAQRRQTILGGIATFFMVVVCVSALLSGQLWMAALTAGFGLMSMISVHGTSLSHLLTGAISSNVFEKMGLSKKLAKVLSDIMVIVVVVALIEVMPNLVAAEGAAAAEGIAVEGAAAAEGFAVGGDAAAAEVAEAAAGDANAGAFQRIWQGGRVPMMTSGMCMSVTGLPTDIAQAATKKKGAQNVISILLELFAVVLTFVGGMGVLNDGVLPRSLGDMLMTRPRDYASGVLRWIDSHAESIANWACRSMIFSIATQGIVGTLQGFNQLYGGKFKKEYEELAGYTALISCAEDIVGQIVNNNQSDLKKLTKAWALFVKNMDAPALDSLGVAHALAQSA